MAKDRKMIRHRGDLFQSRAGYAFISPAFLVLVLMVVYPLIYGIVISFFDTNLVNKFDFVGLKYYGRLIKDMVMNSSRPAGTPSACTLSRTRAFSAAACSAGSPVISPA